MATTDQAPTLRTQTPSIGRIVHYTSYGTPGGEYQPECRAAIVTGCDVDFADLAVLHPSGLFFDRHVLIDDADWPREPHRGGTWHWPERV